MLKGMDMNMAGAWIWQGREYGMGINI